VRALVLCAGRGERLRPLTDKTPKPLIKLAGETLLGRHLARLADAGFSQVVVNVSHLAEQISDYVGDGSRWQLKVRLSREGKPALETGGGMLHALPLLGPGPFLAVNGDTWTDLDFSRLPTSISGQAHLLLVDNPEHKPQGDFGLEDQRIVNHPPAYTYSGVGIYAPALLASHTPGRFSVVPLLRRAIDADRVSGEHFSGRWFDIGSADRLAAARAAIA